MIQMVKLAIPIETFDMENSIMCSHFGRAPKFAIVDLLDDGTIESISSVDNAGEHFGGHGTAMSVISALEPTALIVKGMGPRGREAFQNKGVAVLTGEVNTVGEAISAYKSDRLVDLTDTCKEGHSGHECHH